MRKVWLVSVELEEQLWDFRCEPNKKRVKEPWTRILLPVSTSNTIVVDVASAQQHPCLHFVPLPATRAAVDILAAFAAVEALTLMLQFATQKVVFNLLQSSSFSRFHSVCGAAGVLLACEQRNRWGLKIQRFTTATPRPERQPSLYTEGGRQRKMERRRRSSMLLTKARDGITSCLSVGFLTVDQRPPFVTSDTMNNCVLPATSSLFQQDVGLKEESTLWSSDFNTSSVIHVKCFPLETRRCFSVGL